MDNIDHDAAAHVEAGHPEGSYEASADAIVWTLAVVLACALVAIVASIFSGGAK